MKAYRSDELRRTLLTEFMMEAPYEPASNYWRAVEIGEVIQHDLPKGQGLDLGCGDGHLMEILLRHTGQRKLVGLDVDQYETALAQERNIYRRVVTAPAERLPFCENQFDFVFSNSVLEHIPDIDGALAEVARVLRPGGRFLFTAPGADFHKCLKGPLLGGDRELYLHETDARCFHLRYWNAAEWSEHLQRTDLSIAHQHEYLTLPQVQRWEWVSRSTSGVLYRLLGRKKQPIEIQRQMGIRTPRMRFPKVLASACAAALDIPVRQEMSTYGCLLIEAKKSGG
jgi:ubiquinone/menaquinone biosynthesis C-methylase UbiE